MEYNKAVVEVGTLFSLKNLQGVEFCFENFITNGFIWNNKFFTYVPIEYNPPPRGIDFDVSQATAILPNIPVINQYIESFNGFKDFVCQVFVIFPNNINASPIAQDIMIVGSSRINGSTIEFNLENPYSINTKFPSIAFSTGLNNNFKRIGYVPEVPYTGSVSVY